jgi:metallo-beta-lactamase class B
MKRYIIALVTLLVELAPAAAAPLLLLTPLKPNIYVVEDSFYARENSLVYIGGDHVTVIGATWTPATAERVIAAVAKITPLPITEVVNTNHDLDRAGGNAAFRKIGAKIVAIALTRDLLAQEGAAAVKDTKAMFPDYPDVPVVLPDTLEPDDFTLQNGAIRGLYLGPSHKPDDIFVWLPNEKVLYGGCILKTRLGNMAGADPIEYSKTLRKLKALNLPIETIVAGHMSAVHGPELIDRYLDLLAAYKP